MVRRFESCLGYNALVCKRSKQVCYNVDRTNSPESNMVVPALSGIRFESGQDIVTYSKNQIRKKTSN